MVLGFRVTACGTCPNPFKHCRRVSLAVPQPCENRSADDRRQHRQYQPPLARHTQIIIPTRQSGILSRFTLSCSRRTDRAVHRRVATKVYEPSNVHRPLVGPPVATPPRLNKTFISRNVALEKATNYVPFRPPEFSPLPCSAGLNHLASRSGSITPKMHPVPKSNAPLKKQFGLTSEATRACPSDACNDLPSSLRRAAILLVRGGGSKSLAQPPFALYIVPALANVNFGRPIGPQDIARVITIGFKVNW